MTWAVARLALCFAVVSITLTPLVARAQESADDTEARSLFEAGRTAFDAGRFERALDYFQRAYDLSGRPQLLFNIASTAERLRRDDVALRAYEQYVAELPDAPNRAFAEARIEFLRDAIAAQAAEAAQPAPAASSTPSEVAAEPVATVPDAAIAPGEGEVDRGDSGGGSVIEQWWFWTIVGVAVVGAGVGIGVGVAMSGESTEPAIAGNFGPGGVAMALGSF